MWSQLKSARRATPTCAAAAPISHDLARSRTISRDLTAGVLRACRRVLNLFERANQVDDTYETSKANKNVKTGKSAEKGDVGLELHEVRELSKLREKGDVGLELHST